MVLELWEKIGALDEMDLANVLARMFALYEEKLANKQNDSEALQFFIFLEQVIDQVGESVTLIEGNKAEDCYATICPDKTNRGQISFVW